MDWEKRALDGTTRLPVRGSGEFTAISQAIEKKRHDFALVYTQNHRILRLSSAWEAYEHAQHMMLQTGRHDCNLPRLLEFGPLGVALFDRDERHWFIV